MGYEDRGPRATKRPATTVIGPGGSSINSTPMTMLQAFARSFATREILSASSLFERIVRPPRKAMYVFLPRPKTMLFTSHERIASMTRSVGDGRTGAGVVADVVPGAAVSAFRS
jgi:hypothetical protein